MPESVQDHHLCSLPLSEDEVNLCEVVLDLVVYSPAVCARWIYQFQKGDMDECRRLEVRDEVRLSAPRIYVVINLHALIHVVGPGLETLLTRV